MKKIFPKSKNNGCVDTKESNCRKRQEPSLIFSIFGGLLAIQIVIKINYVLQKKNFGVFLFVSYS